MESENPVVAGIDIAEVAGRIVAELGNWMLGEIGDQGLRDAIWDAEPAFQHLTKASQDEVFQAIYDRIYG